MNIILALVGFGQVMVASTARRIHPLSDEFIDLINSKQTLWTAGRNFHRNTSLKYLRRLTGTIRDEEPYDDPYIGKPPRYKSLPLPGYYDARESWRNCPSLNEIRDQGACGSCWAVSTVSALTDRICIQSKGKQRFHFSEFDVMSCCLNCGAPCDGGKVREAYGYSQRKGIVSGGEYNSQEGCKPYTIPPCVYKRYRGYKSPCPSSANINLKCEETCQERFHKAYTADRRKSRVYYNQ